MATTLALLATVQHSLLWAAPPLPAGTLPVPAAAWVASGAASRAVSGANLTITQQSQRAVLDWQSFNVSADAQVRFDQPNASAAALNRIHDANPSVIQGQLTANGEVYLINANGILFDRGARVNVGGLVASTLGIDSDTFLAGLLSVPNGEAAFKLESDAPVDGRVEVAAGARIAARANGRVVLLAPQVENGGEISTPDGQTILAAGRKAYLLAPTDASLRGFLVEVDDGGSVSNGVGGTISAARGNVTLVGRDVNQNGRVSATSAVSRNGSIRLLARDNVVTTTSSNGTPTVQATRTGALVLGEGSVTEVVPELDAAATSRDDVAFDKSSVELVGRTVHLKQNAAVLAAGGVVDITAQDGQFFETAAQARQVDVRVQMDPGARIDVAGLREVAVPVERNVIAVDLRGDELKDAPLQRNGVLRNKTVFIDAREGTPLADISGFLGQIERTLAERSAPGGEIRIRSEGDVVLRAGASLDVSGGSIRYQDGILSTTKLISDRGVVDISDASPDVVYRGIAGVYETTDAKWGVTRRYRTLPGERVQGYLEGKDAGTISVLGHRLVLDADLRGSAINGPLQGGAGTLPKGGRLVLGDAAQAGAPNPDFLLPGVRFDARPPTLPADFSFMTGDDLTPLPPDWEDRLTLDPGRLAAGGFSRLEVYSNGLIEVDTPLSLAAGGALRLAGRELDIRQDITLPAGSIRLSTHDTFARSPDESAAKTDVQRHGLRVGDGVSLRARGLWTNALLNPLDGEPILPDGGTVVLSSVADLTLGHGSLIDVTGGGQVDQDGGLKGGKGGSISLAVGRFASPDVANAQTSELRLGGRLLGYGIAAGGALTINASRVQIGGTAPDQARTLHLDAGFFQSGGFAAYTVSGADGLTVASGTRVQPRQQSLLPAADVSLAASGSDVMTLTEIGVQPLPQRAPTDISLSTGSALFGALTVEAGATIELDPQGQLSLTSADRLTVAGSLVAPAGRISLRTTRAGDNDSFDRSEGIWLTPSAQLLAAGYAALEPDALGRLRGEVLDGGRIAIDAGRGYLIAERGAVLDVSARAAQMDVVAPDGSSSRQRIAGRAGSIDIAVREGMALDATLRGFGAGAGAGSLSVAIARPAAGLTFPAGPVTLALHADAGFVPDALAPGDAVPDTLNGIAQLGAETVAAGGFDNLSLRSQDALQFAGSLTLALPGRLSLNAVSVGAAADSRVHLTGGVVTLGNDDPAQPPPPAPVAGNALLAVDGRLIDLVGSSALSGFDRVALTSSGDIRLRGVARASDIGQVPRGELSSSADLTLAAGQVYPTTLSDYTLRVQGRPAGRIDVLQNGAAGAVPLSAGGVLRLEAPVIGQAGTLRAPFGRLALSGDSVTLASGSVSSVSGGGRLIPFGALELSGRDYVYVLGEGNRLVFDTAPQKRVALTGDAIDVAPGAVIDVSGGGDLVAFEFTPGPGGSRDVLSTALPDGFAVLPGLGSDIAPHDAQSYQGLDLAAGDMIYLAGGGGLAAGWYPLLPARYALLPGAFWVRPMSSFGDLQPGMVSPLADGGVVMAGARGQLQASAQPVREARWSGYAVRSGEVTRLYSEYSQARASTFFPSSAAQRTLDAGQLSLQANTSLRLAGSLVGTTGAGGRGADVDIAASRIAVLGGGATAPAGGYVTLDAAQLSGLGAASLMIGGLRNAVADRVDVTVHATDVWVDTGGVTLTAPQILLAGNEQVTVSSDSKLSAHGNGTALDARTLHVADAGGDGDGALLAVSAGGRSGVVRGSFDRSRGDLTVAAGAVLAADGSIELDATRNNTLGGELAIADGGELAISAGAVSLGEVPAGTPGLLLDGARLASLGGLGALTLRSYGTLDLYGAVSVGSADLVGLNLETGSLRGFIGAGQTAQLQARRLSLSNPSAGAGQAAATTTGTLRLVASELLLGDGGVDGAGDTVGTVVSGMQRVELHAERELRLTQRGALQVAGALDIAAGLVTADTGADHAIAATGAVTTTALAAPAGAAPAGLGARLALQGSRLTHGARLLLPSGRADLTATAGDLRLLAGSGVDLAGSVLTIGDSQALAPGGELHLTAVDGDVLLDAGSAVDVSAPALGAAGTLAISAAQGTVALAGDIAGGAWFDDGRAQGRFSLDVDVLADFAALNAALAPRRDTTGRLLGGGFSDQRLIRVRRGDLAVGADVAMQVRRFELAADGGSIGFDGTVDASGDKGGRIALAAGHSLTLGSAARLLARGEADNELGYGSDGRGGEVVLAISPDGGGTLATDAGSVIDVSGDAAGAVAAAGGRVHLRAPRVGNDIAIDRLDGAVIGAREVVAEAVRVYDGINTLHTSGTGAGVLLLGTVQADNDSYLNAANTAAMLGRLGRSEDAGFHLRPGVEVRSNADLTLAAAWDLYPLRHQGEPGVLTLRAKGDLLLNANLGDAVKRTSGFGAYDQLQAGESWSYRLVAGADTAAASPLATLPGDGDLKLAAASRVRTGTGFIELAAGGDLQFADAGSIATLGRPDAAIADFTVPNVSSNPAIFPVDGGDIRLDIAGNLSAAAPDQLVTGWLFRQGNLTPDGTIGSGSDSRTAWWIRFVDFRQGIGALGGGDIEARIGGDAVNPGFSIPTTGRLAGATGTTPDADRLLIRGGGDLDLQVGGDVLSGVFHLGAGQGRVAVGGTLGTARTATVASQPRPVYSQFGLGAGGWDLLVRQAAHVGGVFTPTLLPLVTANSRSSYFSTYAADSAFRVTTTAGDLTLENDSELIGAAFPPLLAGNAGNDGAVAAVSLYPPLLAATALSGDLGLPRALTLFPAARGTVDLFAGGALTIGATVLVPDVAVERLPSPLRPSPVYGSAINDVLRPSATQALYHSNPPLHLGDARPLRMTAGGSIRGTAGAVTAIVPKSLRVTALGDVENFWLFGQHLAETDVTRVSAAGDVRYTTGRGAGGSLLVSTAGLELGGPGRLEVLAGGDIDFGTSRGIVTRGNLNNPFLPDAGAGVLAMAGLGRAPDYASLAARYLDPAQAVTASYQARLVAYVQALGFAAADSAAAWAAFQALAPERRLPLLHDVFFAELRAAGRNAVAAGGDLASYQRGFDATAALFPGAGTADSPYRGDINLFFSQIRTEQGGGIDLFAPGGLINAGLANPGGFAKSASELGIVTVRGGSVRSFGDGDFLVNQSRVFTLGGGDILLWSSRGNIDAGRGAKTAAATPPPLIRVVGDQFVLDTSRSISGSGIGVLLSSPDLTPGDVDLIAPNGEVNAGDAGIRSAGNLTIAAPRVVGADNIQVGGVSAGVPVTSTAVSGSLAGAAATGSTATKAAADAAAASAVSAAGAVTDSLGTVTVEVLGFDG